MQLISDEMIELEEQLILQGLVDEETVDNEGGSVTKNEIIVKENIAIDDSMAWSLLNEDEDSVREYGKTRDENKAEIEEEEEANEDHRSILPVDSCDSIPSNYDLSSDLHRNDSNNRISNSTVNASKNDKVQIVPSENNVSITVNLDLEKKLNAEERPSEFYQEKVKSLYRLLNQIPSWTIVMAWFITIFFTAYFGRKSNIRAYEIENLRSQITSLENTISELHQNTTKHEAPGWFAQSSVMMKEWATAVVDIDINNFTFSQKQHSNESTFLDIIPNEAIGAMKNFTFNIANIISGVFEDVGTNTKDVFSTVGTNTKDVFSTVGESVTSFGETFSSVETVTEKIQNISVTVFDIIESQKYALLSAAIYYQVYENFFNDHAGINGAF